MFGAISTFCGITQIANVCNERLKETGLICQTGNCGFKVLVYLIFSLDSESLIDITLNQLKSLQIELTVRCLCYWCEVRFSSFRAAAAGRFEVENTDCLC